MSNTEVPKDLMSTILMGLPILLLVLGLSSYYFIPADASPMRPDRYAPKPKPGEAAYLQTNSKKVALPKEMVERIRRGEEVSAEEVTAALEKVKNGQVATEKEGDDFLPPGVGRKASSGAGARKRK